MTELRDEILHLIASGKLHPRWSNTHCSWQFEGVAMSCSKQGAGNAVNWLLRQHFLRRSGYFVAVTAVGRTYLDARRRRFD